MKTFYIAFAISTAVALRPPTFAHASRSTSGVYLASTDCKEGRLAYEGDCSSTLVAARCAPAKPWALKSASTYPAIFARSMSGREPRAAKSRPVHSNPRRNFGSRSTADEEEMERWNVGLYPMSRSTQGIDTQSSCERRKAAQGGNWCF